MARLKEKYENEIVPALMKNRGYANRMQVPKIEKISINMGLGEAITNPKLIDAAIKELGQITGQKAVVTRARKAISNFKLREGVRIGARVTLRREMMYEFLDRFLSVVLPRVRDFRGISAKAFDGRGNYTLGLKEQIVFPEINYDKVEKMLGMNITFQTNARTDEEGRECLDAFGFPFRT